MYFNYEESPIQKGKYIILPNHSKLPLKGTNGSYAVLAARLMNLGYADYLRMCRDLYGAEIYGKNNYYPIAYFNLTDELKALVNILNQRAREVLYK